MTPSDPLTTPGHAEQFKAGVHLGLFGLAAMCAGYNAMAWGQRRERHLLVNVGVYALLIVFEVHHIQQHLGGSQ